MSVKQKQKMAAAPRRRGLEIVERQWVIDAGMGCGDGFFCFCPLEGTLANGQIVTGMNLISDRFPEDGVVVAIVHSEGQAAAEAFCEQYAPELAAMRERSR